VRHGQWWRIFTAVSLHADIAHLAGNVAIGVLLLGLAMGSFGPGMAVLAAYLAGAGGNLAGLLFAGPQHRSLGASGMVMGALGLLAGQSIAFLRRGDNPRRLVLRIVAGACLLLVLLGLDPHTDVLAHVGGFVSGAAFGAVLSISNGKLAQNELANRAAELICGAIVAGTWALALRAV
jgi:membrane associated rhomboid family serine protease